MLCVQASYSSPTHTYYIRNECKRGENKNRKCVCGWQNFLSAWEFPGSHARIHTLSSIKAVLQLRCKQKKKTTNLRLYEAEHTFECACMVFIKFELIKQLLQSRECTMTNYLGIFTVNYAYSRAVPFQLQLLSVHMKLSKYMLCSGDYY